ncbi:MAG: hypothetical protein VXX63_07535 [Bacteroidota bacterium]|nr:hypothetical protein [Bacteroidota bacterium]
MLKLHLSFFIKLSAFALFFARAYELYFMKSPLQSGLEALNLELNPWLYQVLGILLFVSSVFSLFLTHKNFNTFWGFVFPAVLLKIGIIVFLLWQQKFYWPKMMELAWQICIPFAFVWVYRKFRSFPQTRVILKIIFCTSLLPHALDTFQLFPDKSHFIYQSYRLLNIDRLMLGFPNQILAAFHLAMCIFVFFESTSKAFLSYAVVLGVLIAFARLATGYNQDFVILSTKHFVFDCFLHLPLALIPLSVLSLRMK